MTEEYYSITCYGIPKQYHKVISEILDFIEAGRPVFAKGKMLYFLLGNDEKSDNGIKILFDNVESKETVSIFDSFMCEWPREDFERVAKSLAEQYPSLVEIIDTKGPQVSMADLIMSVCEPGTKCVYYENIDNENGISANFGLATYDGEMVRDTCIESSIFMRRLAASKQIDAVSLFESLLQDESQDVKQKAAPSMPM